MKTRRCEAMLVWTGWCGRGYCVQGAHRLLLRLRRRRLLADRRAQLADRHLAALLQLLQLALVAAPARSHVALAVVAAVVLVVLGLVPFSKGYPVIEVELIDLGLV